MRLRYSLGGAKPLAQIFTAPRAFRVDYDCNIIPPVYLNQFAPQLSL